MTVSAPAIRSTEDFTLELKENLRLPKVANRFKNTQWRGETPFNFQRYFNRFTF